MYNQNPYSTFQGGYPKANFSIPPPWRITDEEFVKTFENQLTPRLKTKTSNNEKIFEFGDTLCTLAKNLHNLTEQTSTLETSIVTMPEADWIKTVDNIKRSQTLMKHKLSNIHDTFLNKSVNILNKIKARKKRRKRIILNRKREKEERLKQWAERSRMIDENLQKIKDEDEKLKQEQDAKAQADIVLKEILRKKGDAKKCILKLDYLVKLRKARQNTARGRGEDVSERDAESFNNNIEKLKSLWVQKLTTYEKEESELRSKLKEDNVQSSVAEEAQRKTSENLAEWKACLFGDQLPQRDFAGDIGGFVRVRSQWDRYISGNGTTLPIGWVLPSYDKLPKILPST